MLSSVACGADQLREERLRFVAASPLEQSLEDNEDCWDHSSEDEDPHCPDISHNLSTVASSAAASTNTTEPQAESYIQADTQQALTCHGRLPEHTKLTAAVKQLLQQHGMVRNKPLALGKKPAACLYRCIS